MKATDKLYNIVNENMKLVSGGYAEHAMKDISSVCVLTNGKIVTFNKPRIDTHLCFGWSQFGQGMEIKDARELADNARTNADYFIRHNIERSHLESDLENLKNNDCPLYYVTRKDRNGNETGLAEYYCGTWSNMEQMKRWYDMPPLCDADRQKLTKAVEQEIAELKKRLNAYIKRYGTTKLRVWTFCCDD